jgi:hypothetical protein
VIATGLVISVTPIDATIDDLSLHQKGEISRHENMPLHLACLAFGALNSVALIAQDPVPPLWNGTTNFTTGTLVRGSDSNYYRAIHNSSGSNPLADNHTNWELFYVNSNVNLKVSQNGARFQSLKAAWDMARSATIAPSAKVRIVVIGTFTESFPQEFSLNAVSGNRITIQGERPESVTLKFPKHTNGFTLTDGNIFGGISGVTIVGSGRQEPDTGGFRVNSGAVLLGAACVIKDFAWGLEVSGLSRAICSHGSAIRCDVGIQVAGAQVLAVLFAVDGEGVGGAGYTVVQGNLSAMNSSCKNVKFAGYQALDGGCIDARRSAATNTFRGYFAVEGGSIAADFATSTQQSHFGIEVTTGTVTAIQMSLSGNSQDFNIPVNAVQSNLSFIKTQL